MFDIDYIKRQYCNYKCPVKLLENSKDCSYCDVEKICNQVDIPCSKCYGDNACENCQINNFIKELKDFKII